MNAIVHFSVGLTFAMCILVLVSWPTKIKFPLIFVSGGWAMLPDGWQLIAYVGPDSLTDIGYAFHRSVFANVFWFHQVLDQKESGEPTLEMTAAVVLLLLAVVMFTTLNTWE